MMSVIMGNGTEERWKGQSVVVRAAGLSDADQLIECHKTFRSDMAQWERGCAESQLSVPIMDKEDVHYIIEKEDHGNMVVLVDPGDPSASGSANEERIVGYSYSYAEKAFGEGGSQQKRGKKSRPNDEGEDECSKSVYIAELFVQHDRRGLGLGELLLFETLKRRCRKTPKSHLFVSGRNANAIRIYKKFGYESRGHSGDESHDLVMQLEDMQDRLKHAAESVQSRFRPANHRRCDTCGNSEFHFIIEGEDETISRHGEPSMSTVQLGLELSDTPASQSPTNPSSCQTCIRHSGVPKIYSVEGSRSITPTGEEGQRSRKKDAVSYPKRVRGKPQRFAEELCDSLMQKRRRSDITAGEEDEDFTLQKGKRGKKRRLRGKESTQPRFAFALSGFVNTAELKKIRDSIQKLGGVVLPDDGYSESCTHVVSPCPMPTEKFLCGLAAGKALVHTSYITKSETAGQFLPVDNFEWCALHKSKALNEAAAFMNPVTKGLAKAIGMWRKIGSMYKLSVGGRDLKDVDFDADLPVQRCPTSCFEGMVAVLVVSEEHQKGLRRLLEAGGAKVCADLPELHRRGLKSFRDRVTHVFLSDKLLHAKENNRFWKGTDLTAAKATTTLLRFHANGAKCLHQEYVVDLLTFGPRLVEKRYVVDIEASVANARS